MEEKLSSLISYIKSTFEYRECIRLKEKMKSNEEICSLVDEVKVLQKKYIRSLEDESIKKELDEVLERLNNIPIYVDYLKYLDKVNQMINYVKDELNDYFYEVLNKEEI